MLKHGWMGLIFALIFALGGAAFAQTTVDQSGARPRDTGEQQQQKMGPDLSIKDRQFVERVASDNLAGIKLARLALERSQTPEVRKMAQAVLSGHETQESELKAIVRPENFPLPTSEETIQQLAYERLSKLSGKEFDRAYLTQVVADHDQQINVFRGATGEASYQPLRTYAAKTLPLLQEHREMAKSALDKMGPAR
jgi:putative membrane protein